MPGPEFGITAQVQHLRTLIDQSGGLQRAQGGATPATRNGLPQQHPARDDCKHDQKDILANEVHEDHP